LQSNRGDATFEPAGEVTHASLGGEPFVLGDLDDGGIDELGVFGDTPVGQATTELSTFVHDAGGTFRLQRTIDVLLPSTLSGHVLGDFDGDGARDVAFYGREHIALLQRSADGFSETVSLEPFGISPTGLSMLIVGDLDGDGA